MHMWRSTIAGIVLGRLEELACCASVRGDARACADVHGYVLDLLALQPWYFRWPLACAAWCVGAACVLLHARPLLALAPDARRVFLSRARRAPGFSLLATFVESTALLRTFDYPSFATTHPHNGI